MQMSLCIASFDDLLNHSAVLGQEGIDAQWV